MTDTLLGKNDHKQITNSMITNNHEQFWVKNACSKDILNPMSMPKYLDMHSMPLLFLYFNKLVVKYLVCCYCAFDIEPEVYMQRD